MTLVWFNLDWPKLTKFDTATQAVERRVSKGSAMLHPKEVGTPASSSFWDPYLPQTVWPNDEIWYDNTRGGGACFLDVSCVRIPRGGPSVPPKNWGPPTCPHTVWETTRSSADADNGLDAFSGQSRSTNMVPFHMLHIVSYCAIVTLSRRFYDIRLQKISWPWNGGQRSLKVIESDIIR